jgi:hypothetical protein
VESSTPEEGETENEPGRGGLLVMTVMELLWPGEERDEGVKRRVKVKMELPGRVLDARRRLSDDVRDEEEEEGMVRRA